MIRHRPLSLSDRQMQLIRESAKHVPHDWRSSFLNLVVDLLEGGGGEPDDKTLAEAIGLTLARLHLSADPPCAGDRAS